MEYAYNTTYLDEILMITMVLGGFIALYVNDQRGKR